ncbi:MAG: hypothetical protein CMG55_01735 [Candidatus Marinimicrobia bacterium]|nr:hypothetical protein [Candidatus Neomarinimicrobiota bacterium]|tara:strand:- start:7946 stop:8695 length:750 start_codon:yes stop_codon:yes gene_type:complete
MNNAQFSILQSLKFVKYRKRYNKFLIEGKRLIQSALNSNFDIGPLYCSDTFKNENSEWIKTNLNDKKKLIIIKNKQLLNISNTKSPSGIISSCSIPKEKNLHLKQKKWLYLDKISNPGNMGTLMRSAAWFGISNIALSPYCVDPYNPKTVRSAMGAHFNISIHTNINLNVFVDSHSIIAGNSNGKNIISFSFPKKCVLVLGNEAHGISKKNKKFIKENISINKLGVGESLNVSSAGAIFLYLLSNNINN